MVTLNLGLGGAQRAFHDHRVALCDYYDVAEAISDFDLENLYPVRNPFDGGGGGATTKLRNCRCCLVQLRGLKQRLNADVCISHLRGADRVSLRSKWCGKVVLLIQGSRSYDDNISRVTSFLRKKVLLSWLYKRADHIVAVSRDYVNLQY